MTCNKVTTLILAAQPTWPSAVVAIAFIALLGFLIYKAHEKAGIDGALKMWAALGTLTGILGGAIPTYFFTTQQTKAAQETARLTQSNLHSTQDSLVSAHETVDRLNASLTTMQGQLDNQLNLTRAAVRRADEAESRLHRLRAASLAVEDVAVNIRASPGVSQEQRRQLDNAIRQLRGDGQ